MRHELFVTIFKLGSSFTFFLFPSSLVFLLSNYSILFLFDFISFARLITSFARTTPEIFVCVSFSLCLCVCCAKRHEFVENEKIRKSKKGKKRRRINNRGTRDGLTILKCFVDTCYWMTRKNYADVIKWQDFSIPFHFFHHFVVYIFFSFSAFVSCQRNSLIGSTVCVQMLLM